MATFRFLTINCGNYKATQQVVNKAKYNGTLLFVNWHRNQVMLLERTKNPQVKCAPFDRTEKLITASKQLCLNLET